MHYVEDVFYQVSSILSFPNCLCMVESHGYPTDNSGFSVLMILLYFSCSLLLDVFHNGDNPDIALLVYDIY